MKKYELTNEYVICCYMQFGDKPAIEFTVEANDFGKTVFLTCQEAEAALMKMEGASKWQIQN